MCFCHGENVHHRPAERAKAMDHYLGHMDGDLLAEPGRSQAVSTDVADVVEGRMPELMFRGL
jgi:hypothetical protein